MIEILCKFTGFIFYNYKIQREAGGNPRLIEVWSSNHRLTEHWHISINKAYRLKDTKESVKKNKCSHMLVLLPFSITSSFQFPIK